MTTNKKPTVHGWCLGKIGLCCSRTRLRLTLCIKSPFHIMRVELAIGNRETESLFSLDTATLKIDHNFFLLRVFIQIGDDAGTKKCIVHVLMFISFDNKLATRRARDYKRECLIPARGSSKSNPCSRCLLVQLQGSERIRFHIKINTRNNAHANDSHRHKALRSDFGAADRRLVCARLMRLQRTCCTRYSRAKGKPDRLMTGKAHR